MLSLYLPGAHFFFLLNGPLSLSLPAVWQVSFSEWADKIQASFERHFWVPESSDADVEREGENAHLIHRRGIYKDSLGASNRFSDFQLRPNFPLAMVVVSIF